jgi:hypothetical protein
MSDVRSQVEMLLRSGLNDEALAQELDTLVKDPDFSQSADLWAPALYDRDPRYFAPFLARNLTAMQADVIKTLLPRMAADGQRDLFIALYRVAINEADWNADLSAQAQTLATDDALAQAVRLRADVPAAYALGEDLALVLYQRIPTVFAQVLLAHVLPGYDWQNSRQRAYQELRQAAKARADDAVYWRIFRVFADTSEWTVEMMRLAQQPIAPADITQELAKRRLDQPLNMDPAVLVTFLDRYGTALIPFVDANLDWFGRLNADLLLEAIERMGDAGLLRRVFFRFGNLTLWNKRVRAVVEATPDDATLAVALQAWLPPTMQLQRRNWWLEADLALRLYQRNPDLFRDFVQQTLHNPLIALFDEAEDHQDEALLDAITFGFIDQLATTISTTFPYQKTLALADFGDQQRGWVQDWTQAITDRFARLYAQSPATYVRHAATILRRGMGSAWKLRDDTTLHPVAYLCQQHHAAWVASSAAMRDLLETPDLQVLELAVTLLGQGGPDAAQRVVEELPVLQALLLGEAHSPLKKQTLRVLERAAAQSAAHAARIAPLLAELMYFHNDTKLDDRAMVSFVRARHYALQSA